MYGEKALAGKRAVVIGGAGRGIGREVTRALSAAGAALAIVDIDGASASEAANELAADGTAAVAVAADVLRQPDIDRAFETAVGELGGIDVLVTVVGGFQPLSDWESIHEVSDQTWDLIYDFNLRYVFRVLRAGVSVFLNQGRGGTIVTVGSIGGRSIPLATSYAAAKAGLLALTKSVAVEHARDGIRANSVTLGVIENQVVAEARVRGEAPDDVTENIPLGRWGAPRDVANAVVFLASPLSDYTTGTEILVDGGASARIPLRLYGLAGEHMGG
jgi:3-oxoacyl-[acyl-carrier protein] reductase